MIFQEKATKSFQDIDWNPLWGKNGISQSAIFFDQLEG